MHATNEFLSALALVLCVAAVTTVVFQRLRQPVVLGYMIAGLIVGPHVPVPLVADPKIVHTLSELGVILLMFSLGLEFSLRRLMRVGPTAGLTAILQCSVMLWLGFSIGRAFGWTTLESLFGGALLAISSTTIIAKAFEEQGASPRLREIVVGILVVEDLIAVVLIAVLTAVSTGAGVSAEALGRTVGQLGLFLAALIVAGLLVVPRAVRYVLRLHRPETTVVACVGLAFGVSLLALHAGYSIALGAFLAGSLVAESGRAEKIEHLVQPVRDVFAAIFFVSVGMMIEPALVLEHWDIVAVLTVAVIVGKIVSVAIGAFLTGAGTRTAVQSGLSLAQIGEFSFIIAGVGLSLGATRPFLYPVAIAVSAITTLTTPFLIRASGPFSNWVDRKMPRPLQTFAALYASWIERLRPRSGESAAPRLRQVGRLLALDLLLLAGGIALFSIYARRLVVFAAERTGLTPEGSRLLVAAVAALSCLPFAVGALRLLRRLAIELGERAFPRPPSDRVDLAVAPRQTLVVTLQLAGVLLTGLPLLALASAFVVTWPGAIALALVVAAFGVAFWRRTLNLDGHVRAGAQVVAAFLGSARSGGATGPLTGPLSAQPLRPAGGNALDTGGPLQGMADVLPGVGEIVPLTIETGSPLAGRTLGETNFRGLSGATVLAIRRGTQDILVPTAAQGLQTGDVLAVSGSSEAIRSAARLASPEGPAAPES